MKLLSDQDRTFWHQNGYVVIPDVVPAANLTAVIDAIAEFTGKNLANPECWYQEPMVGGGMVNMNHNQALWDNRQAPKIHQAFAEIWDNQKLWVTYDRANMNPPTNQHWQHRGMIHWDLDMTVRPLELCVQGVLYLTDTAENQGGFQCVPKSHHQLRDWLKAQPADQFPKPEDVIRDGQPVSVSGRAGDLLIWHSGLLHGNGHNSSDQPRLAQYIGMQPEWTVRTAQGVTTCDEQGRQDRIKAWRNAPCQPFVAHTIGVAEGFVEQWLRQAVEKIDVVVEVEAVVAQPENGKAKVVIEAQQQPLEIVEQLSETTFRVPINYAGRKNLRYQKRLTDRATDVLRQIPAATFTPQLEPGDLTKFFQIIVEEQIWGVKEMAALINSEFGLNNQLTPAQLSPLGRRLVGIDAWDTAASESQST